MSTGPQPSPDVLNGEELLPSSLPPLETGKPPTLDTGASPVGETVKSPTADAGTSPAPPTDPLLKSPTADAATSPGPPLEPRSDYSDVMTGFTMDKYRSNKALPLRQRVKEWNENKLKTRSNKHTHGLADRITKWIKNSDRASARVEEIEEMVTKELDAELIPVESREKLTAFVKDLVEMDCSTKHKYERSYIQLRKKHKMCPRKAQLSFLYYQLLARGQVKENLGVENGLLAKAVRSASGVLPITVFTSPYPSFTDSTGKRVTQSFSCKHNCHYCPNEPDLPRSYLSDEPGVARGKRHRFDACDQFFARAWTHSVNGHPIDKIEILVLGGTWSEYPRQYQEEYLRDIFWSANVFYDPLPKRKKLTLTEEQVLNERAVCRIIGLTLETRPDSITPAEIKRLRYYGATRMQIGIQHTDYQVLKKTNRGCYREDSIRATRLLKDAGFKIDFHLMPDLPGSTPELDRQMFQEVLFGEDLQADQWKIYPCEVVPWTKIEQWFKEGKYKPHPDEVLFDLILEVKRAVHPWIRLNRVIRDIPDQYIMGGNAITNLRQHLQNTLKQQGLKCRCIRCREVGTRKVDPRKAVLKCRTYKSSGGLEYFLSFELPDESVIFGFLRLRHSGDAGLDGAIPELVDCALIRELHVYGTLRPVGDTKGTMQSQHGGFGKRLMSAAEFLSRDKFSKIAVIAGIGTREYYRDRGYRLEGTYMVKDLGAQPWLPVAALLQLVGTVFAILYLVPFALALAGHPVPGWFADL